MISSTKARAFVAVLASTAFFWTLTLSVSPQLHERIHPDANRVDHSCAVTLITSGNCNHSPAAPLITAPAPIVKSSRPLALNSIWVRTLFLDASVFEHAPPAHS